MASAQETVGIDLSRGLDKIAHFGAYLILGALLTYATTRRELSVLVAVGLGFLYGLSDEIHQSMVPGRTADFADWLADAAGTLVGILIYLSVTRLRAGSEIAPPSTAESTSR